MKDDDKSFLAVDLGASSGRAVLGTFSGGRLSTEEVHRFPNTPVELRGTVHWDVLGLFREIEEGIRLASARSGLSGIGVDTWGVDFGLLDEAGRLVGTPVHYRDSRTDGIMERVFEIVPRQKIFETTGIQFLQLNTIFQLAAMKMGKWPELDRARTLLMMPDLMNYFLCGRKVCEFTEATTTQLYDPCAGGWAMGLIEALGLPSGIFPEIIMPGEVLGEFAPAGGVPAPVIAPATHDTGSAVAAVPAVSGKPGWAYISSGTWSLMGIEIEEPIINEAALSRNFTNEGGVGGTFRFLKNIAGLWFLQECRRVWGIEDGREPSYQQMEEWAKEAKPFRSLIDPDHHSFLRPENMPRAMASFCENTGQDPPSSGGEMVRCALESLALKYRAVRRAIEEVSGVTIEVMHVVGGGCRNRLLNQFTADALGLPVLAGPVEATAVGNLLVQAMAAKVLPGIGAARDLVRSSFPLETYEPGSTPGWDEAEQRFKAILEKGARIGE